MKEKDIDIRIIRLGKWQIPRTKEITKNECENNYLSIGYFDMINIIEGEKKGKSHLFTNAYMCLSKQNETSDEKEKLENLLEEYTIQELIGYTNVGENGFSLTEIKAFWEKKSFLLFVSLIHIDCDSDVNAIVERIREKFKGKNYLYYFAFDYSGIIIFAKEMNIEVYLHLLFELNYEKNDLGKKLIRDSYSFYGMDKEIVIECFERFSEAEENQEVESIEQKIAEARKRNENVEREIYEWESELKKKIYDDVILPIDSEDTLSITINIGVQNFEIYKKFLDKVKRIEPTKLYRDYGMLGRHDISITKENITLKWLVYVQYILNGLVIEEEGTFDTVFSAHETFGKVENLKEYNDTKEKNNNKIYAKGREKLSLICEEFEEKYEKITKDTKDKKIETYDGQYLYAIRAVKHSILSILKNRYAEEFVLCIYRPFIGFLDYLSKRIEEEKEKPEVESFDICYRSFFSCLDSLVNCAMHSERQFIQITAFNATIYDVPSKLLAFYMSLLDDMKEIMAGDKDKTYTFILTPSFANKIKVQVLSYRDEKQLPHDRILNVEINEKSLYNPPEVERTLVHEISHYLGDEFRKRDVRRERLTFTIVYLILAHIFPHEFLNYGEGIEKLAREISKYLLKMRGFVEESNCYSNKLRLLGKKVLREFRCNEIIKDMLYNYIVNVLGQYKEVQNSFYVKQVVQKYLGVVPNEECDCAVVSQLIMNEISETIEYININRYARFLKNGEMEDSVNIFDETKNLNNMELDEVVGVLVRMYNESYADIQKILVTGMCYQDYLLGFLGDENDSWEFHIENNLEDMGRISMVSMVIEKCGLWKYTDEGKVTQKMNYKFYRLHNAVQKIINGVNKNMRMKDEETFIDFRKKHEEYISIMSYKTNKESLEYLKMSEQDSTKVKFLNTRIYFELLRYLYRCVETSVKEYRKEGKRNKIEELRKTMWIVNESKDVQEVFEEMNRKIREYRDRVFEIEN